MQPFIGPTFFVFVITLSTLGVYLRLSGEEQLRATRDLWNKREHHRGEMVKSARNEAIGRMFGFAAESLWIIFCSGAVAFILYVQALSGDPIAPYAAGGWLVMANCVLLFVPKRGNGVGLMYTVVCVNLVDVVLRTFSPQEDVVESRELLADMAEAD